MDIRIGKRAKAFTQQEEFTENVQCDCGGNARIGFAVRERGDEEFLVCDWYKNLFGDGGSFWPHDAIAVAVYFCEKCAKACVRWNQA